MARLFRIAVLMGIVATAAACNDAPSDFSSAPFAATYEVRTPITSATAEWTQAGKGRYRIDILRSDGERIVVIRDGDDGLLCFSAEQECREAGPTAGYGRDLAKAYAELRNQGQPERETTGEVDALCFYLFPHLDDEPASQARDCFDDDHVPLYGSAFLPFVFDGMASLDLDGDVLRFNEQIPLDPGLRPGGREFGEVTRRSLDDRKFDATPPYPVSDRELDTSGLLNSQ